MFEDLLDVLKSKYDITVTDRLEKHLGMHVNQYANDAVGLSQPSEASASDVRLVWIWRRSRWGRYLDAGRLERSGSGR